MKCIDIHTHGGFGINFDNASEEALIEYSNLAYKKGIVAFCPTLTGDSADKLNEKLKIIKKVKELNKKGCAKIIGAHLEGTFLSKEKRGVQNPENFLDCTIENFEKISKGVGGIIKIVVVAPENKGAGELISYLKKKGIKVHFGHTNSSSIQGAQGICHLYNAMGEIKKREENLPLNALLDNKIYTELIADTVHVSEKMIKLTFKIRPVNKILLISDSLPIAGSNLKYVYFCSKKVYKNGLDEKGTIGGSVKLLPDIIENLLDKKIIDKKAALITGYENQANYLKLMV